MQTQLERQRDMAGAILSALPDRMVQPRRIGTLAHPERLAIHVRNTRASLTAALASIFPATQRLTGEGFFAYAAAQFIAASPPRVPIIDNYGADLPGFLEGFHAAGQLKYLPDLARLEWLLHDLSLRPPAVRFVPDIDYEAADIFVTTSRSSAVISSPWAIGHLRTASHAGSIEVAQPARLHLWAEDDGVAMRALDAAEFAFVAGLYDGLSLGQAIAQGCLADPAFDAGITLGRLFATGCLTALHIVHGDHS